MSINTARKAGCTANLQIDELVPSETTMAVIRKMEESYTNFNRVEIEDYQFGKERIEFYTETLEMNVQVSDNGSYSVNVFANGQAVETYTRKTAHGIVSVIERIEKGEI